MTIKVGDKVPSATLMRKTADGIVPVPTDEYFAGKKVVLFSVPGAFTPTCSAKHLPGFVKNSAALKAKGIDAVACVSVNDAFVMDAWGKDQNVGTNIDMLADGSATFAKAVGLDMDLTERGLGVRGKRYAMVVENGVVKNLFVEPTPGDFEVSSAEHVLGSL